MCKAEKHCFAAIIELFNGSELFTEKPIGMYRGRFVGINNYHRGVLSWMKDDVVANTTYLDFIFNRICSISRTVYYLLKITICCGIRLVSGNSLFMVLVTN